MQCLGRRFGSREGLFWETLFVLPPALAYAIYLYWSGTGAFLAGDAAVDWLLVAAGAVTALPLVWFASAARRLEYATVGFFQYLSPSLHFLLAVFLYGEPFGTVHLITFACIWAALAIFSTDSVLQMRRAAREGSGSPGVL